MVELIGIIIFCISSILILEGIPEGEPLSQLNHMLTNFKEIFIQIALLAGIGCGLVIVHKYYEIEKELKAETNTTRKHWRKRDYVNIQKAINRARSAGKARHPGRPEKDLD